MTALAVEMPTPLWAGRAIVRAAGRMALHVAVEGAQVPSAAMFTVPVECRPDAESAPGVRPWAGPVDEGRLCAPCLRALRGEPEAELASAGACKHGPDRSGPGPARTLPGENADLPAYDEPGLPAEHDGRPIRWSEWGEAPKPSHACGWCGDPGPGAMAGGRQGNPLAKDDPLRWFVAYRCSYCQETRVYQQTGAADLKPIAHFKPRSPKGVRA
ncbi:hypothetical protein GCM10010218_12890 [Streptomyces mashuensis]|uniref:Uncharacterized protein n=1 Tax=Streptomyces mashuensis TaxID=33904 RepID=A0A919AYY8_9ACTN|nr:hypothetical protein GCM10010218_12890 [Streptomyces mashuensis]